MAHRIHLLATALLLAAACDGTTEEHAATESPAEVAVGLRAEKLLRIGGKVGGLAGIGLTLDLNGIEDLTVNANGQFYFGLRIPVGASYVVTVKSQPTSAVQACTVSNGTGVVGKENVKSIAVKCSPTGIFVPTGSLLTAREDHSATLLPNGRVLIAGGRSRAQWPVETASAELYDPFTGLFEVTGSMITARFGHTATLLPNGKVLVAGGAQFDSSWGWDAIGSAEVYDPDTGSFAQTGRMQFERHHHTATLLRDGKVLMAAGWRWDVAAYPQPSEIYDPASETFTSTGTPRAYRWLHTATLLHDGKVLVVGGLGAPDYLMCFDYPWNPCVQPTFAELYDPLTTAFSSLGDLQGIFAATLLESGKVLMAGSLAVIYDPEPQQFTSAGTHACGPPTATLLTNGAALLVGGACAEIYDPNTLSFAATDTPNDCSPITTATSLSGGSVLITCGSGGAQVFEMIPPFD